MKLKRMADMKHGVWGLLVVAALMMFGCADYIYDETPPDPVSLSVSTLTDSTVTLSWSYTDIEEFKGYEVRYSKTSSVVDGSSPIVDTLTYRVDTTITVMKLDPRTKYYFRVNLLTTTGLFSPSNIVDATTLSDVPAIVKITAKDTITDSSVILKWTKSAPSDFVRYRIFIDSLKLVDTNSTPKRDIKINDTGTVSYMVSDLSPSTKYYVRIHVETARGLLYSSVLDSFTTASNIPAPVVMNTIRSPQCTDSSIVISWKKSTEKDVAGYIICRDTSGVVTLADSIATIKDTVDTIFSLKPNTDYSFAVAVKDSAGNVSLLSDVKSQRTYQRDTTAIAPEAVVWDEIAPDQIFDTSITLIWTASVSPNIKQYHVCMSTTSAMSLADSVGIATSTNFTVKDLIPNTAYWFAIVAENKAGKFSPLSEPRRAITKPTTP